jgi:hypothetical protein
MNQTPSDSEAKQGPKHEKKIHVEVFSPKEAKKGKKFTWELSMLVSAAAREAADKFGYASQGTPGLSKAGQVLDNTQSLEAAGVVDGDELTLVDTGGGV